MQFPVPFSFLIPLTAKCTPRHPVFEHPQSMFSPKYNINEEKQVKLYQIILIFIRGCNQKFPDRVDNKIYAYNNKHSSRSNTKGYGGKTR
jgi:hypothetical protein